MILITILFIVACIFFPPLAALVGVYLLSLVAIAIVAYIQEWLGIGIFGAWIVAFFAFIIFMFLLMVGLGALEKALDKIDWDWRDLSGSLKRLCKSDLFNYGIFIYAMLLLVYNFF